MKLLETIKLLGWLGKVYLKSATSAISACGLRNTGLCPCIRHVFDEDDPGTSRVVGLKFLCAKLQEESPTTAAQIHRP
jgi:hypothetical protein